MFQLGSHNIGESSKTYLISTQLLYYNRSSISKKKTVVSCIWEENLDLYMKFLKTMPRYISSNKCSPGYQIIRYITFWQNDLNMLVLLFIDMSIVLNSFKHIDYTSVLSAHFSCSAGGWRSHDTP